MSWSDTFIVIYSIDHNVLLGDMPASALRLLHILFQMQHLQLQYLDVWPESWHMLH